MSNKVDDGRIFSAPKFWQVHFYFFLRMHFQVLALIASEAEVAVVVIVDVVVAVAAVAARSYFGLK